MIHDALLFKGLELMELEEIEGDAPGSLQRARPVEPKAAEAQSMTESVAFLEEVRTPLKRE